MPTKNTIRRNAQRKKYYNKHSVYRQNRYVRCTKEQDSIVLNHRISDVQISRKIGKSVQAVQLRRYRLKNMKTFQRTNWSNEQILHFLDGQKLVNGAGEVDSYCQDHNDVIDDIKDFFYDFMRPETEFGAMGYCVEEDTIYHIGGLPEPLRMPIKECAIHHSPENESNFKEELRGEFYCKICGEDWP